MKRKLAVPLAVSRVKDRAIRTRILKDTQDVDDIKVMATLAENRQRLQRLEEDLEFGWGYPDSEDTESELDEIKASIELSLLDIADMLDEVPDSEAILDEVVA